MYKQFCKNYSRLVKKISFNNINKSFLLVLSLLLILFLGIPKVEAKTIKIYTNYNVGDKVTIQVNDTTTLDFYVIKSSNSNSDEITAILSDTSYPTKYNYSQAVVAIEKYKSEWYNADNVYLPTMKELIGIDANSNTEEGTFSGPSYVIAISQYWLQDVSSIDLKKDYHWVIGSDLSGNGKYGTLADNVEVPIRPAVKISKNYVIGGVIEKEDVAYGRWEKLVKKMENADPLIDNNETNNDYQRKFASDENSMSITLTKPGESYVVKYIYNNGIVTFDLSDNTSVDNSFISLLYNYQFFNYVSEIFGYNSSELINWIGKNPGLGLEKDGFQYTSKNFSQESIDGESKLSIDLISHFDFDLEKGFSTLVNNSQIHNNTQSSQIIEIPNTKKNNSRLIIVIASCFLLMGLVIMCIEVLRKNKYSK